MDASDIRFQAEKYLMWLRRGNDGRLWWRSKDFTQQQRRRIEVYAAELLAAPGDKAF